MPEWLIIVLGLAATLAPIGSGWLVAQVYRKMGGGEAQLKLNVTLKDLNDAYEDKLGLRDATIAELRNDFIACKTRLETMEAKEQTWMEERIELKKELAEVYRRLGMTKREGDPA